MAERKRKRRSAKSKTSSGIQKNSNLIPSGNTNFNCALTDNPFGGYRKGTIVNLIGDSSAGKSILAHTCFAAANAAGFDDYRFIFDDAECGADFDTEKLFGESTAKRIEPPSKDAEGSETIEDFQLYIHKAIQGDRPFIYVLDSFDGLDCEADRKKAEAQMKKREKGEDEGAGSYGQAKNQELNKVLRRIRFHLKRTNSILIIVSQVRDNFEGFSKVRRTGGKALKHYSWQEVWLKLGKKIKSKDLKIGVNSIADITKNRETGKERQALFSIYYDLGIDDVGSCVDALVDFGYWQKPKSGTKIKANDFDLDATRDKIIKHIEQNNEEEKLQELVGKAWLEREESLKLKNRKKRFD